MNLVICCDVYILMYYNEALGNYGLGAPTWLVVVVHVYCLKTWINSAESANSGANWTQNLTWNCRCIQF